MAVMLVSNEMSSDKKIVWYFYAVSVALISTEIGFELVKEYFVFASRSIVGCGY